MADHRVCDPLGIFHRNQVARVDVLDPAALAPRQERRGTAHGAEGADWAIDSTGDVLLSLGEELFGLGVLHASPIQN